MCADLAVADVTRYKDAPPKGTKPDPDYVPKDGEWFWYRISNTRGYGLRERRKSGVFKADGSHVQEYQTCWYGKECLPAEPPE